MDVVALDDDSSGWPNPAISASRGIVLAPNTDYYLVVSAYAKTGGTPYGTVAVTLGGSAKFTQTLVGCCKADFNQSGAVTSQDLFDFLAAWFAHAVSADINGSGSVTSQDLFDFLAAWFAKCV